MTLVGVICITTSLSAQSVQPPLIQWQRAIENGNLTTTSSIRAAKAQRGGGYGILSGRNLVLLSAKGEVTWNKEIPGSYADSTTARIAFQEAISLTPTPDGGFAVLALDAQKRYYVAKLDSAGGQVWTRTVERPEAGSPAQLTQNVLSNKPDGSLMLVGSFTDRLSYLTITELSSEGYITGRWRIKFQVSAQSATPLINRVLPLPNQGYLLVGRAAGSALAESQGSALQLNAQYALTWQKQYPTLRDIQDVVMNAGTEGTYTAVGAGPGNNGQAMTIAPNKAGDGNVLASIPGVVSIISLVYDGAGNLTVLDAAPSTNGDFRLSSGRLPATFRWTKSFGGSGTDKPTALLATDDGGYLAVGTTTSTDGDIKDKSTKAIATWVLKLGNSPQVTTLRLLPPVYDCQTGLIRFHTSGGDGSPVRFSATGVALNSPADSVGTVEQAFRTDSSGINILASQHEQTVSYSFNVGNVCRTDTAGSAPSDSLRLIAPTYNCETGLLTFHTAGGDSSQVEYAAEGITGWTTSPTQVVPPELRTMKIILMARQRGKVVTYAFDSKAECGRARLAASEEASGLTIGLRGNPVYDAVTVDIKGAQDQSLLIRLVDGRGRLVEQRTVEQAGGHEQQTFDLRQQPAGALLLSVAGGQQVQTVKVIKQ
ncbi:hypothetical protein SD10_06135 [Spirosoma radiotolerans]|uniref:Secretion system C-terminal sorting domain-containing protein n=2 Tax=Spirosoma radiotolerans TaxID=1379870 RepID=A0A0E3ZTD2_9BACT|nr:hypothetical protein SD10_06135 [Spirosoma radiotolerans]